MCFYPVMKFAHAFAPPVVSQASCWSQKWIACPLPAYTCLSQVIIKKLVKLTIYSWPSALHKLWWVQHTNEVRHLSVPELSKLGGQLHTEDFSSTTCSGYSARLKVHLNEAVGAKNGTLPSLNSIIIHSQATAPKISQIKHPILLQLQWRLQIFQYHLQVRLITAPRYLQLSTFKAYDNISDKIIAEASATD